MAIGYDEPVLYDDPAFTYDGEGGDSGSAGGYVFFSTSVPVKKKPKKQKPKDQPREPEPEPETFEPETFEEIIAEAFGEDGAVLLMALLDD